MHGRAVKLSLTTSLRDFAAWQRYEVYICKVGTAEVDFIAIGDEGEEYYQVAYSVMDEGILNRELHSLQAINDHNPKMDEKININRVGIFDNLQESFL